MHPFQIHRTSCMTKSQTPSANLVMNDRRQNLYEVNSILMMILYRNDEFDTLILIFSLTDTRPFLHATYTIKSKFFFDPDNSIVPVYRKCIIQVMKHS